jgi:alpha-glucosidase
MNRSIWITIFVTGSFASTASAQIQTSQPWWQHAVIYEIYPRSFQDSDGDGTGDLKGITQRLDYLKALGVDAIWLAPMYSSPQVDFGYDISDFENVDPRYGTMADFDRLINEANRRHIRVILDMVLNHTSDKHPWFLESASSPSNPKHNWYIWDDGKYDNNGKNVPPNNWVSVFGGAAWEWSPTVSQFYFHEYYKQQPDLNWRNPDVEKAMFGIMRFWLDRGVAGFRLDAITNLFKDSLLRDEPTLGSVNAFGDVSLDHIFTDNLPEVHDTIRRMRAMISAYPEDRVLIGETYLPTTAELDKWYGSEKHDELQLPMDTLIGFHHKLDANVFRQRLSEVYTQIHGSRPLLVFDNHDNDRSWDRYGDGVHDAQIAKLVATLLLTAKATVLLYQGEEIGQVTTKPTRIEDVKDPLGITGWPKRKGRDGERTPMQWDQSNGQAGFSSNPKTWLPVSSNYKTVNVQSELADPYSLLVWHKSLITMRRRIPALRDGTNVMLDEHNASVLSYARVAPDGTAILVVLNMSPTRQIISLDLHAAGIVRSTVVTLLASPETMSNVRSSKNVELAPFASWIASIR